MTGINGSALQFSMERSAGQFERLSFLIVDGDRHLKTLLKGVLHAFGIRSFREADNGAAAITLLRGAATDALITEFAMENVDGIALTKWMRRSVYSPNHMAPILMLSGRTELSVVAAARDAGVNELLAKPISAAALHARILSAVFNSRPFVKVKTYFGPDRRRRSGAKFAGVDRRMHAVELAMPPGVLASLGLQGQAPRQPASA
jgi:DNA-binding response OmpR family regulator